MKLTISRGALRRFAAVVNGTGEPLGTPYSTPKAKRGVMTESRWRKQELWILEGTFVELHPCATGGWFVVDGREPDRSLGEALDLAKAKKLAGQIVARRLALVRK